MAYLWERPREEDWSRCPLFLPPGPEVGRASFPVWRETRAGGEGDTVRPAERNAASTEIMNGRGFEGVRPVWKTVGAAGFAGEAKGWSDHGQVCAHQALDLGEHRAFLESAEGNRDTRRAGPPGAADPVDVRLRLVRQVS